MKIGQQTVDRLERPWWLNEQIRVARPRTQWITRSVFQGGRFKNSNTGCADCDHSTTRGPSLIDDVGTFLFERSPFVVHLMFVQIAGRHRPEGSDADMKRHLSNFHALVNQITNQVAGQMQPGSWRRDGSRVFGEYGLIVVEVGVDHIAATNVVRQWNAADLLQQFLGRAFGIRTNHPRSVLKSADKGQFETFDSMAILHRDCLARLSFAASLAEHLPDSARIGFQKQALPTASGRRAKTNQLCRNHFCVVQHNTIAGAQDLRQVANVSVID